MPPPFHRLEEFVTLTPDDIEMVQGWAVNRRQLLRQQTLRREGDPVAGVFFLFDGWVGSSLMLRDGRRQIVKIHLPGDMLGFPSLALQTAGETLEALSDVTVCTIPTTAIGKIFERSPRLAAGLFLSAQKERVALMQELSWVGAASALERMVAFLLDLYTRLEAVDRAEAGRVDFPVTQQHIGEMLGLTAVHVNRTLKRLDQTGLIERGKGWIRIANIEELRRLAPNLMPKYAGCEAWQRLSGQDTVRKQPA